MSDDEFLKKDCATQSSLNLDDSWDPSNSVLSYSVPHHFEQAPLDKLWDYLRPDRRKRLFKAFLQQGNVK
jgi:hypothetical protein